MCRLKTRARKNKEVRASSPLQPHHWSSEVPPSEQGPPLSSHRQPLSCSASDMTRPSSLSILPANPPLPSCRVPSSCSHCYPSCVFNGCAVLLSQQPPMLLTGSLPALSTHKLFTHKQILRRYEPAFRSHDQPRPKSHPLLWVY